MKIKGFRRRAWARIPAASFSGIGIAPQTLITDGTVGSNMEVGLASDADGPLVGHTGITANRLATGVQAPTSAGNGLDQIAQWNNTGLLGLKLTAVQNEVSHLWRIPAGLDRRHPLRIRLSFITASTTAADKIKWISTYSLIRPAHATGGDLGQTASALDTAITEQTIGAAGAAGSILWTEYGILNGGQLQAYHDWLKFTMGILTTDITLASEDTLLLELEVEYTPKWAAGLTYQARLHQGD